VVPGRPFEIGVPPFHVWPTGCCMHPILYFKNVSPLLVSSPSFWFLATLLLHPGDGPVSKAGYGPHSRRFYVVLACDVKLNVWR